MTPKRFLHAAVVTAGFVVAACNQADPPGSDGTGGTDSMPDDGVDSGLPLEGELGSLYPLVDGAMWTYVSTNAAGQALGMEIVEASAITYDGADAFLFVDNPNADGEWTESTIARKGTAAMRVFKELKTAAGPYEVVEYDPGFMRVDDAWTESGGKGELTYMRSQTDGMGSVPDVEMRGHIFNVTSVSEMVTTPAGVFDCIAVERVRTTGVTAGERVLSWYAAGVGKVKEERPADNRFEELTTVSIPGGASHP